MSSKATRNRIRLSNEIRITGRLVEFPCFSCTEHNLPCIMNNKSKRCSECARTSAPCVSLSWSSLDETRAKYTKLVEDDEELLAVVMARLLRNKKILRQANERAAHKAAALEEEMEAAGELPSSIEDCPAADATVGLTPAFYSTIGLLEDVSDFSRTDGIVAMQSYSS
jgi:hypothetical protein